VATASPRHDATLDDLLRSVEALETLVATWQPEQQNAVRAYRTAVDDLHREAMRRLIAALKDDSGARARLREVLSDEVVYAVLRQFGLVKPSIQEKIEAALESVRPMLQGHGGNVELVSVKLPDTVAIRFMGACNGCSASQITFIAGVKKAIQDRCPEIRNVIEAKGLASGPASGGGDAGSGVRFQSPFASGVADDDEAWQPAATLSEIPLGGILHRAVSGHDLLFSRNEEVITCFTNACAHLGTPLEDGPIEDGIITCTLHGFQYSLATGECLTAPAVQLEQHVVRLIGQRVEVLFH
jgi:Fe-S cluster biogenesis protein NfuA/nitrite reductase/ring-hydroxylating ferredoxin subunit